VLELKNSGDQTELFLAGGENVFELVGASTNGCSQSCNADGLYQSPRTQHGQAVFLLRVSMIWSAF